MRTYLKRLLIFIYILFIMVLVIIDQKKIFTITLDTLSLWLYKVFPPILIFYILSSLLLSSNAINILVILLKPLRKFLRFETDNAFKLFIISIFLGNPSSSVFTISYLENGNITYNDANVLNKCSSFITPLFIFSLLPFNTSFFIYIAHVLSNILICIFLTRNNKLFIKKENPKLINFFDYLEKIPQILFKIAILMIMCNIFSYSLSLIKVNSYLLTILELSTGSFKIISMQSIYKLYYLLFLISFNGFCIHLQVYTIIKDRLSYLSFLMFRIIQGFISLILFFLINTYFT